MVEEPKPAPPVVEEPKGEQQKFYDIVNGSESGPRSVTRVSYVEAEDGTITITSTDLIESTIPNPRQANAAPKVGAGTAK